MRHASALVPPNVFLPDLWIINTTGKVTVDENRFNENKIAYSENQPARKHGPKKSSRPGVDVGVWSI
jgi:hypothetical protein